MLLPKYAVVVLSSYFLYKRREMQKRYNGRGGHTSTNAIITSHKRSIKKEKKGCHTIKHTPIEQKHTTLRFDQQAPDLAMCPFLQS
jgi:hypothetical protein